MNLPLHHGIKISKDLCLKTDEELDRMSRHGELTSADSGEGHWTAVKNILKYLRITKDSSKQDIVADSTCESGYIAACED
ncbi:hypothetical protein Tco_0167381 [Tanacetum coccineum]